MVTPQVAPQVPRTPGRWARVAPSAIAVAAATLALAVTWRLSASVAARLSDRAEGPVSQDGSFVLLATILGVVTAVVLWRRPGAAPARRLVVVLLLTLVGSVAAVLLAGLAGGPRLAAWGAVVLWPLITAVTTAAITAGGMALRPDQASGADGGHL